MRVLHYSIIFSCLALHASSYTHLQSLTSRCSQFFIEGFNLRVTKSISLAIYILNLWNIGDDNCGKKRNQKLITSPDDLIIRSQNHVKNSEHWDIGPQKKRHKMTDQVKGDTFYFVLFPIVPIFIMLVIYPSWSFIKV